MTAIYKLGKIGAAQSNMPDVTTMTQGEFNRFLEAQRFQIMAEDAASGERAMLQDIADAIDTGDLSRVPASLQSRVRSFMERSTRMNGPAFPMNFNGTQKKQANASSGVGSIALTLLQPFINWLFNIALPVAAPFFLYIFLDNSKAIGLVVIKKAKQIAILQTISNITGTPYGNLKAAIRSSLIAKLGMDPTQLLNDYINVYVPSPTVNVTAQDTQDKWDKMNPSGQNTGGKIGAVPAVVGIIVALLPLVIKAIPVVLEIAGKLIGLLGKNEPGLTDAEKNAPDPEFDFAATFQSVSNLFSGGNKSDPATPPATPPQYPGGGINPQGNAIKKETSTTTIAAGAAALVGLYLLFK
jgi:hypothetical protein